MMIGRQGSGAIGQRTVSAVLAPVFRDGQGELRVLLVKRGTRGIHGGQLGLPGGKREPEDDSTLATALREAHEEVGLSRNAIEILTALEPLDTMTSGYRVHAYLASIRPPRRWRLAAGEIRGVITPTVSTLVDPSIRQERELSFATWTASRRVRCVVLDEGQLLWGVTLRLLDPVLPRLLEGEWPI
ncbi:MAG: CoA pyrophosphatase [Solirubrobacterales bacterium]|nr:CoA pyrophosphatase [Solirubrobacterales bacterium]